MAGNRKHGFMRGNASGRNGNSPKAWSCAGCNKEHGARTNRTLMKGDFFCDRTYLALKEMEFQQEREARIQRGLQLVLLP